jgi:hypothetical protein
VYSHIENVYEVAVIDIYISVLTRVRHVSSATGHVGLSCYAYDLCLEGAGFEPDPGESLVVL